MRFAMKLTLVIGALVSGAAIAVSLLVLLWAAGINPPGWVALLIGSAAGLVSMRVATSQIDRMTAASALVLALTAAPISAGDTYTLRPDGTVAVTKAEPREPAGVASPGRASTVMVNVGRASGTGTCIASEAGRSLILTNAHVVEGPSAGITVLHQANGVWRTYPCEYVGGSRVTPTGPNSIEVHGPDLALIVADGEIPAAKIADDLPPVGSPVHQWGFGGQYGRSVPFEPLHKTGTVAYHEDRGDRSETCTTFRSQSGDSGSGVFNDRGELVAVTAGLNDLESNPRAINRGVRLDVVRAFVAKVREKVKPKADKPEAKAAAPCSSCGSDCGCTGACPCDLYARVAAGETVHVAVGVPASNGCARVASMKGIKPGLYRCVLENGVHHMYAGSFQMKCNGSRCVPTWVDGAPARR